MSSSSRPPEPHDDGNSSSDDQVTSRIRVRDNQSVEATREIPVIRENPDRFLDDPDAEGSVPTAEIPQVAASQWRSALTAKHWAGAVLAAVGAYASMLVCAALLLLLVMAGAVLSADGSSPAEMLDDATASIGVAVGEGASAVGALLSLPVQLVAMAFFGRLALVSPAGGGQSSAEVFSLLFSPVLITAVGALVLYRLARRFLARATPVGAASAGILSLAGGLVLAVLVVLLASSFAIRSSNEQASSALSFAVEAASTPAFVVAWLLGALVLAAALVPRGSPEPGNALSERREQFLPSSGRALPVLGVHLAVFGVPVAVLLIVAAFVQGGWAAGLSTPLWVPTAVLWFFSWGHLSGITVQTGGAARELLTWAEVPVSGTSYLWGTGLPAWVVAVVLVLAALAVLLASVAWLLRRDVDPAALARPLSWMTLPALYLLLGLLLTFVARVAVGADVGALGLGNITADAVLRPAGWTCLVLLGVGALVEVLSRYVAPAVVAVLPAGLVAWLGAPARSAPRSGPASRRGGGTDSPTGSTAAASAAAAQQYATAARKPRSAATRKKIRRALLAAGALATLVVGAAVAYSVLSKTVYSPSHEVESYLQAVVDGRAVDAARTLDPNVPSSQRLLLNDEIYDAAAHPVTSYSIRDVTVAGSTAEVSAEITQDAVTTPVSFTLTQDGRQDGVFKDWTLEDGGSALYQSVSVELPEGATELTVNGQQLDLTGTGISGGDTASFVALPGDYVIAPPSGGKYISYGNEQTVEVRADGSGDTQPVAFTASPTDAVREDAIAAANAKIDECAAQAEFAPENCPFGNTYYSEEEDYRDPEWTVESYPTYTVEEGWDSLRLRTDEPGELTLEYERNTEWDDDEPADWEEEDDTETVYISAPIEIDGDTLTLDWSDSW